MLKKLLRLPIQIFVFILFTIVVILSLAQLQIVKDRIKDILVSELNKSLNGEVYISRITGNFLSYIEISGLSLKVDNDYLLKADAASIKLNPFALIDNKIIISEFRLLNPLINIKKATKDKWNFELLTKSQPDTSTSKSNLRFDLSGIELINGRINFNNTLYTIDLNSNSFNTSQFILDNFNLSMNLTLNNTYKKIDIGHLSFLYNKKNSLKELSGVIYLDKNGIKVDTLNMEYNTTLISMSTFLYGIDIENDTLSIDRIKNLPIGLNLNSNNLNTEDIAFFLPDINFITGNLKININTSGSLKELYIEKVNLSTLYSNIKLYGKIENLYDPNRMILDIKSYNSQLDLTDLKTTLSPLSLPDYSKAGIANLNIEYYGKLNEFKTKIDLDGNFGRLFGSAEFDLSSEVEKYKIDLVGNNINLNPFLGPDFNSRLNLKIEGNGNGFSINNINTNINILIDSSRFLQQTIDKSKIAITLFNKHCNALIAFSGDDTKIGLNTEFNLNPKSDQSYNFNLSINNLDLSKFTNNPEYSSDINLSSSIKGNILSFDKTNGEALVYIFPSKFKNDSIPELSLDIKYNQSDLEDRKIYFYSDIVDIEIRGKYQIEKVNSIFSRFTSTLNKQINTTLPFPKPEDTPKPVKKLWIVKNKKTIIQQDTVDFNYFVHIKRPEILKKYINCKDISSNIEINGNIKYEDSSLFVSGNANIDNLYYLSKNNNILIQDSKIKYFVSAKESNNVLFNMNNKISIDIPIAYLNKNSLENINLNFSTNNKISEIKLTGEFDKKTSFDLAGKISLGKEYHDIAFSKFHIKHLNYEWINEDNINLTIQKDGLDIQSLILSHADERIIIEGNINKEGEQNLSLLITNLSIENLLSLISSDTLQQPSNLLTGKINLSGEIFGTAEEPIMNLFIRTDSLSTNYKYLGSLFGKIHYEESELYTNIQFQSSGIESLKKSDLVLIGTIPINLSMQSDAPLFPDDEEIDLYLVTNKLPLRLVSLIVPEISNPTNTADINFHVFGTGNAPEIEGYVNLNKGSFKLEPNGITYISQGRCDINTKQITLAMFIENLPEDRKDGRIEFIGNINMTDLKLDKIDIRAKGQLQILSKEKRKSNKELYGDLLISTVGEGIKYRNDFKSKTGNILTGEIIVKDANLYLPLASSSSSSNLSENEFKFILIDDTSKVKVDSSLVKKRVMKQNFEKYVSDNMTISTSSAFDKLDFRLDVKTLGNAKIEIEMDPILGEALVAEIGGNISIVKSRNNLSIYGSSTIGEKSYYKFAGKKFDASGKIIFSGSLDNPELDMKATYQGIHVNEENLSAPKDETVVITIIMTGSLLKPTTKYEMTVDGKTRDKGDTFNDIISFILTGKFNDELTSNQKQNLASNYSSSLYSIGSGVISGRLTEFFKNEFEFIRSVETEYSGELTTTNVKISGEIANTAIFRFGGKVFSDINNTNINLELPVGKILNKESLRNLILEIYRNSNESTKNQEKEKIPFFGTRIFYRINF